MSKYCSEESPCTYPRQPDEACTPDETILKSCNRDGIILEQWWIFLFSGKRKIAVLQKRDNNKIMRDFRLRQSRQFFAIAVTLVLVLFLTLLYKRSDLFGEFSKDTIFAAQVMLIVAFIGFSAFNWRCPACKKYLGTNINRRICKQCGTRLR